MIDARPEGGTVVDRATEAFRRYREGERPALDDLVAVVTPLLWRTVRATGLDEGTSEDVVQTTWLALLHAGDGIREPRTVVKWLLTTARREAWRVHGRLRADEGRKETLPGGDDDQRFPTPDHLQELPDEAVLRDARRRRLWEHVWQLPPRCRQLVGVIAFADRPDYALLADALGMPVGSIGPTRGRCLAKLRDRLDRDPHWEEQLS